MNRHILVCDDESHIRRAVRMKLEKGGFEVRTAADGQEAWEDIHRELPALLISDCQMPRMGGLELCRRLRAQPETEHLPIILLTAKGFELEEERLTLELWLSHVVVKPFSPRELLKLVQELSSVPAADARRTAGISPAASNDGTDDRSPGSSPRNSSPCN